MKPSLGPCIWSKIHNSFHRVSYWNKCLVNSFVCKNKVHHTNIVQSPKQAASHQSSLWVRKMCTAEKGVLLIVCNVQLYYKKVICTFVLLMKPGKNNFPFPQISWTVLYYCTKQQKCRTINGIREKKTVTDTYPMLYRFCSMGSFLFCIIMSKNVNNGHKVYFLPRCICKGQVHDSKNDF